MKLEDCFDRNEYYNFRINSLTEDLKKAAKKSFCIGFLGAIVAYLGVENDSLIALLGGGSVMCGAGTWLSYTNSKLHKKQ